MKVELIDSKPFVMTGGKTLPFSGFMTDQAERMTSLRRQLSELEKHEAEARAGLVTALIAGDAQIDEYREELAEVRQAIQDVTESIRDADATARNAIDSFVTARASSHVAATSKTLAGIAREIDLIIRKTQP